MACLHISCSSDSESKLEYWNQTKIFQALLEDILLKYYFRGNLQAFEIDIEYFIKHDYKWEQNIKK